MSKNVLPSGAKGGQAKPHKPKEMEDNLLSINKIKILLAVSDGECDPEFTMQNLLLNDVAVQNADGTMNYQGVKAEFRPGTQTQDYIKGFSESSSEITVNRVITPANAFPITITDKNLSAVRFKIFAARMMMMKSNGDRVGTIVEFAIDQAVDGGSFVEVLRDKFDGKTTSGYDRSIRVDLPTPQFNTQVIYRVRRITPLPLNSDTVDEIMVQSYALVVDAKFRYPLTGLVYVEFDSETFGNQVPSISTRKKWKLVQVPTNYNPLTRTTSGTWNGTFKTAWTNNPAWVLYDIITNQRYGLDQKELGIAVDKWSLYDAAAYCDQMVPDGKGGQEPRYLCDVVIQSQIEAYRLVRDICSIFRGMSFWNGESLSIVVDRKRDPVYIFTNDNVVNGAFSYTFASDKSMYTSCNVTFDDRENLYQQDVESVFDTQASLRFAYNPTEITAIGCTRRSEANRRGRWVLKTNLRSTTVNFATGLEGMIPTIGDVVAIQDNFWATNLSLTLAGRVMEVSGLQVFTPYRVDARAGDFISVNKPDGAPVRRTIASVSPDGKTITLNIGFGFDVQPDTVFAIDRTDLALQQYVVTNITKGDGDEEFSYSITAVEYDPGKYDEIDYGVTIDDRPTSIVDPDNMKAPTNVQIDSFSRIVQGLSVETMVISWDKVPYASYYEVQWKKDDNNWQNVPRTANQEVEIEGIYSGNYFVRVRSVSAGENASAWSAVVSKGLTGKVGAPKTPINLTASTDQIFGIRIKWGMPEDSGDTAYIELQQSPTGNVSDASLVTLIPYPQFEYWHSTLPSGYVNFYRIRSVDRIGNVSAFTQFVRGMASDNTAEIMKVIKVDIEATEGFKQLAEGALSQAGKTKAAAEAAIAAALAGDADSKVLVKEMGDSRARYRQTIELIANETEARVTQIEALDSKITNEIESSIVEMKQAISTEEKTRTEQTTALNSRIGGAEAAIVQKMDSFVDSTGAGATYGLNLGLRYNGVEYKAGVNLQLAMVNGSLFSQFLVDASRFGIMRSTASGAYTLPFVVQGDQVYINNALIATGSITNAMIGNFIQSNNYQAGVSGWNLDKSGVFEINGQQAGQGRLIIRNDQIVIFDEFNQIVCVMGRKI